MTAFQTLLNQGKTQTRRAAGRGVLRTADTAGAAVLGGAVFAGSAVASMAATTAKVGFVGADVAARGFNSVASRNMNPFGGNFGKKMPWFVSDKKHGYKATARTYRTAFIPTTAGAIGVGAMGMNQAREDSYQYDEPAQHRASLGATGDLVTQGSKAARRNY